MYGRGVSSMAGCSLRLNNFIIPDRSGTYFRPAWISPSRALGGRHKNCSQHDLDDACCLYAPPRDIIPSLYTHVITPTSHSLYQNANLQPQVYAHSFMNTYQSTAVLANELSILIHSRSILYSLNLSHGGTSTWTMAPGASVPLF